MAFDLNLLRSYGYDEATLQSMADALGEQYTPPQQGAGTATSYAPGSLQMIPQADGSYQAVNPRTGQAEVVYNDNDTSQMYFPSDGKVPATAQPAGVPTYHSDTGFGTLDEFLSRVIPGALAAIPAAASLAAPAAAAAGGGSDATLQAILDSAAPAGESFTGPATGTVLEPGVQASGAFVNPVAATPTLAELGATPLSPLAAGAAGGAAAGGILSAVDGGTPAAASAATGTTAAPEIGAGTAAAGGVAAGGALQALGLDQSGTAATQSEIGALGNGLNTLSSPTSIGGTKLSDILSGNVSPEDLAKTLTVGDLSKILGTGLATAGSVAADQQRTDALKELNDKYMAIGAPSRDRYEASYAPGFDINSLPGLQGALDTSTQSILRGLSTNGNPFGNPGGLAEALKYVTGNVALPALNQYRNQNAATGGYGAFSTAAPSAATGAINASGDIYSDLGRGIGNITNPTSSLEQLLKQIKGSGVSVGGLT